MRPCQCTARRCSFWPVGPRRTSTFCPPITLPPACFEAGDSPPPDGQAFCCELRRLERRAGTISAEDSARSDDAVVRKSGNCAAAEDPADGTGGARTSGNLRHVTVGRDASLRDPTDDGENGGSEGVARGDRRAGHALMTSPCTTPSACGGLKPAMAASAAPAVVDPAFIVAGPRSTSRRERRSGWRTRSCTTGAQDPDPATPADVQCR